MNRRTFLKIAGMGSISFAAGCTSGSEKTLYSLVHAPENMVPGTATWYATTCRECPAGCGVVAKNREGRVVKLEGNPYHPVNAGALCARGQAGLQRQYHPDRLTVPLLRANGEWESLTFDRAASLLREKGQAAGRKGPDRVRMLTETVGDRLMTLFTETLAAWNAGPPVVFEAFAYETLRSANRRIYGREALPAYRLSSADALIGFGADFLETWLSPVEYSRDFKTMHAADSTRKTVFVHVSPYQSLTAANADLWIPCKPGGEAFVALGLLRETIQRKRSGFADPGAADLLRTRLEPFSTGRILEAAGVSADHFQALVRVLDTADRPLCLPTGTCAAHPNALQADMAVNLLNLWFDPRMERIDFAHRHRVEQAAGRTQILDFLEQLGDGRTDLLVLSNVNPAHQLPPAAGVADRLAQKSLFVVALADFLDETARLADLVIPLRPPLESWGEYAGRTGLVSLLQPAMGRLYDAPDAAELFLRCRDAVPGPADGGRVHLFDHLLSAGVVADAPSFVDALQRGGIFELPGDAPPTRPGAVKLANEVNVLTSPQPLKNDGPVLIAAPSHRFFDGRSAHLPWLCELPEPLTQVAWQSPLLMHPDAMKRAALKNGDIVEAESPWGNITAPVYPKPGLHPDTLLMYIGQGHPGGSRYAGNRGSNPLHLMAKTAGETGGTCAAGPIRLRPTGRRSDIAHVDGHAGQLGRKIAMTVAWNRMSAPSAPAPGLTMNDFPLTLPLPEGYDPGRDFYPPHDHSGYRWAMTVDLDRCIGCGACTTACYAENNIGVVGEEQVVLGREMTWLRIDRYVDGAGVVFLPMMCQHCDNAPCESVCPVYAPHHGQEGMNNQIYNRCIGTRFCSQNCPYKVRRFNWYAWQWPDPLPLQLNPNVTVRAKGVMEKCSFCIQRVKEAHGTAKNENRRIRDGEILPACVQTCPTGALTFGDLTDPDTRVRRQVEDPRAYQVMGYLNTKPAVIYLRKVLREV